jgi:exonuclease III
MTGKHHASLNINNECKCPNQRHRKASWVKKQDPTICCFQETHLTEKINNGLESKGKKMFQANGPHKQVGVAILILNKEDFRLKSVRRDNEVTSY